MWRANGEANLRGIRPQGERRNAAAANVSYCTCRPAALLRRLGRSVFAGSAFGVVGVVKGVPLLARTRRPGFDAQLGGGFVYFYFFFILLVLARLGALL